MNLSPRVSVCRSRRQHGKQGNSQRLARKDLWSQVGSRAGEVFRPAGRSLHQLMPREVSVAWSSPLVCGARLSQQWSGACLNDTLTVVHSTLLGLLISILAPRMASGEFAQELQVVLLCRHVCSGHVCRYVRCVSLPGVSALT